ncbi:M20 family dipeptidase [Candidatus Roizmanbacteria bacterium]|nr:M20 family dipeptidase [Candidatus Roizmanbacteria bacterium]
MKNQTLDLLSRFISIPSVSTDPNRFTAMKEAVRFITEKLTILGFEVKFAEKGDVPPLIIASRIISPSAKTIGIYGHYDVQPEDPVDEWRTVPFELTVREGKMYGRGIADNKGHVIQNITAIEALINEHKLSANVIFLIEGEEELGSEHFEEFVTAQKELLQRCDVFYVTDMGMHGVNIPEICYALRGLVYFELEVNIGESDLHSGVYGNRVLNPIQVLSDLFVRMKDIRTGKIFIPGFYDEVRKIPESERALLNKTRRTDEEEMRASQTYGLISQDDQNPALSTKIYPSFDVHGIIGGFVGEGSKTVIPRRASAKFSYRLVEFQNPEKIVSLVQEFVKDSLPPEVKYTLTVNSKGAPFYTSVENEFIKITAARFAQVFGNETIINRSGGSVGAAVVLSRLFGKPIILTGFTLPDDNIHAPNENFDEGMFWKGIEALKATYCSF